ncbi:MAG: hypothetical protein AAGB35_05320, partial [Pseudomonadota bacterium]
KIPIEDMIAQVNIKQMEPFIEYCSEKLPELKNDFANAYSTYVENLRITSKEVANISHEIDGNSDISQVEMEIIMNEQEESYELAMKTISQTHSGPMCKNILIELQSTDLDSMRELIQDSLEDYKAYQNSKSDC